MTDRDRLGMIQDPDLKVRALNRPNCPPRYAILVLQAREVNLGKKGGNPGTPVPSRT